MKPTFCGLIVVVDYIIVIIYPTTTIYSGIIVKLSCELYLSNNLCFAAILICKLRHFPAFSVVEVVCEWVCKKICWCFICHLTGAICLLPI
jgi:hypothetical protein